MYEVNIVAIEVLGFLNKVWYVFLDIKSLLKITRQGSCHIARLHGFKIFFVVAGLFIRLCMFITEGKCDIFLRII
jgi:hypothetical protein